MLPRPRPYLPCCDLLTGSFGLRVYELHGEVADVDGAEPSGRRGQCFRICVDVDKPDVGFNRDVGETLPSGLPVRILGEMWCSGAFVGGRGGDGQNNGNT